MARKQLSNAQRKVKERPPEDAGGNADEDFSELSADLNEIDPQPGFAPDRSYTGTEADFDLDYESGTGDAEVNPSNIDRWDDFQGSSASGRADEDYLNETGPYGNIEEVGRREHRPPSQRGAAKRRAR